MKIRRTNGRVAAHAMTTVMLRSFVASTKSYDSDRIRSDVALSSNCFITKADILPVDLHRLASFLDEV